MFTTEKECLEYWKNNPEGFSKLTGGWNYEDVPFISTYADAYDELCVIAVLAWLKSPNNVQVLGERVRYPMWGCLQYGQDCLKKSAKDYMNKILAAENKLLVTHEKSGLQGIGGTIKFELIRGPGVMEPKEDLLQLLSVRNVKGKLIALQVFPGSWSNKKCFLESEFRKNFLANPPPNIKCSRCHAVTKPFFVGDANLDEEQDLDDSVLFPQNKLLAGNPSMVEMKEAIEKVRSAIENIRGPFLTSSSAGWLKCFPISAEKEIKETEAPAGKLSASGETIPFSPEAQKFLKVKMICEKLNELLRINLYTFNKKKIDNCNSECFVSSCATNFEPTEGVWEHFLKCHGSAAVKQEPIDSFDRLTLKEGEEYVS